MTVPDGEVSTSGPATLGPVCNPYHVLCSNPIDIDLFSTNLNPNKIAELISFPLIVTALVISSKFANVGPETCER